MNSLGRLGPLLEAVSELAARIGARRSSATDEVELYQKGTLRTRPDGRWLPFDARQSIRIDAPAFEWTARVGPLGAIGVKDGLRDGVPFASVSLFGFVPVSRARPSLSLLKGELMRYLAELPWAPDALLANPRLAWRGHSDGSLSVAVELDGVRAAVTFILDSDGFIESVWAPDRPRLEGSEYIERPWLGTFGAYRNVAGRRLPCRASVAWEIDGDFAEVWRGELTRWTVQRDSELSERPAYAELPGLDPTQ